MTVIGSTRFPFYITQHQKTIIPRPAQFAAGEKREGSWNETLKQRPTRTRPQDDERANSPAKLHSAAKTTDRGHTWTAV